jgi:quinol---cytochrome-c reductase cytochrome c subunit
MRTIRTLAATLLSLAALTTLVAGLAHGHATSDEGGMVRPPAPRPAAADAAEELYLQSCASCHGRDGGGSASVPSIIGVGSAAVDFQLRTGRMPFAGLPGEQAMRKPVAFTDDQVKLLVDYVVNVLGSGVPPGPEIPDVTTDPTLVGAGQQIFIDNCAPCHGATGQGGAVGGGALAPPLDQATAVQVGEAMLAGPGQMPVFDLPLSSLNAAATYVGYLQTASHPGGFSIGGIGPVPEGYVGWILGAGLMVIVIYQIGRDRPRRTEPPAPSDREDHT